MIFFGSVSGFDYSGSCWFGDIYGLLFQDVADCDGAGAGSDGSSPDALVDCPEHVQRFEGDDAQDLEVLV